MRGTLLMAMAALFFCAGAMSAWVWNSRRSLPYNEQGRYFDADDAVVLSEQAVGIYGITAIVLIMAGIGCWIIARKV